MLYFATNEGDGIPADPSEGYMIPADNFIGATPKTSTTTSLFFKPITEHTGTDGDNNDEVILTHLASTSESVGFRAVCQAIAELINAHPHNDGFTVVADHAANSNVGVFASPHITGVTGITLST